MIVLRSLQQTDNSLTAHVASLKAKSSKTFAGVGEEKCCVGPEKFEAEQRQLKDKSLFFFLAIAWESGEPVGILCKVWRHLLSYCIRIPLLEQQFVLPTVSQ